jgi:hypothetical protein
LKLVETSIVIAKEDNLITISLLVANSNLPISTFLSPFCTLTLELELLSDKFEVEIFTFLPQIDPIDAAVESSATYLASLN